MKHVVPWQLMEDISAADIHTAAHGEPHPGAGGHVLKEAAAHEEPSQEQVPGRSCVLWRGVSAGAGFLVGVAHGEPTLEQSVSGGLYAVERIRAEAVLEELLSKGRTHVRTVR